MRVVLHECKKYACLAVIAGMVSFAVFVCLAGAIPLAGERVNVYTDTVRLRVVADNDSAEAQELKRDVRDALLPLLTSQLGACRTVEQARSSLHTQHLLLEQTAVRTLREKGCTLPVHLYLHREKAPVRRYGAFTFPAGEYLTLRVDIGRAQGHNWWCVLYPSLSLSLSAEEVDTATVAVDRAKLAACGFTAKQIAALEAPTEKPEVRLAFWEWVKGLLAF